MKKRIARIVVYFGLTCLTALVLSHPYIWQSIFGPKIKGEPLWAWQQEFRARSDSQPPTLVGKLLSILKIDSKPMRWIGGFDSGDPELLPVLISLADDGDENVRCLVAYALFYVPPDDAKVALLIHMLDDPSSRVRHSVLHSLQRFGSKSERAVPKLRELLRDPNEEIQMSAAVTIIRIDQRLGDAQSVVRNGVKSPALTVRRTALDGLIEISKDDKDDAELFALLLDYSQNEPDFQARQASIRALRNFGKKSVPHLLMLLSSVPPTNRVSVNYALASIGPEAAAAIPALEGLVDHSDRNTRTSAEYALKQIDPTRAAKK